MGSYSVVQCIRHMMGQPLCCSALDAGVWGEKSYGDGSTPCSWLRSITFFHGCLSFLHRHFPPQSLPSHPLDPSQQQPLHWDYSTIPKLQLQDAVSSRGPASLSGVCMAVARPVWFPVHLGCHRSAVSLSILIFSPLTQTIAPMWGLDPCFSSPTCQGHVQSY